MNQLIYVETSIPSFYFETRPGAQIQARREWMRKWWDVASVTETHATSPAVFVELSRTPEPKRSDCLGLLASLPVLEISTEVRELVRIYVENKLMPDDTEGDAMHLALATLHQCDILVSWNCRHIANANKPTTSDAKCPPNATMTRISLWRKSGSIRSSSKVASCV